VRELLADFDRLRAEGRRVALARVVAVDGSSPRELGAALAVNEDGEVAGSVSGGCVESAVVTTALEVLASGRPSRCTFGCADDDGLGVGLVCGGALDVFVEPFPASGTDAVVTELVRQLRVGGRVALATVVDGPPEGAGALGASLLVTPGCPSPVGSLGAPQLDHVVVRVAGEQLEAGTSTVRRVGAGAAGWPEGLDVFVHVLVEPPRLVIVGAGDVSIALAAVAKVLGYAVTVCDPRPVFADAARFPTVDHLVVEWPDRLLTRIGTTLGPRDAVCVLAHDPKFEVPAVAAALGTEVGYVGVLGSRRTVTARRARLRDAGLGDDALDRVMEPVGLDIGARTPAETAVAIVAEMVAVRTGHRSGTSLRDGSGPIHGRLT
jgi:xanthine dehydrogenase accessory factor